jgi:purine nucleosidase
VWFRDRPIITFHDPLAAATIFAGDLCRFVAGQVEVELGSPRVAGLTYWTPRDDGPHQVAVEVEGERFFEHYFGLTTATAAVAAKGIP